MKGSYLRSERLGEMDRDRQELRVPTHVATGSGKGPNLGQRWVARGRARLERFLRAVVPGIELGPVYGGGPSTLEYLGRRAKLDVGVDERAAADSGRRNHGYVAHQADVEQPAWIRVLVPQHPRRLQRVVGKVLTREAAAALEYADSLSRLSQPAGGNASAEPGADDDHVVRTHGDGDPNRKRVKGGPLDSGRGAL